MPKIVVTQPSVTGVDDPRLTPLHEAGWSVAHEPSGAFASPEQLLEIVQGADAVIASSEPYTRMVLERADTLKHVARWGVGFDQVDVPAATELGVLVTTTQGANDWGVADHAFALMLALARRVVENDALVRRGEWRRPPGRDIWQKTLGIVGLGRIGKGVAERASGFRMKVLAYEPYPDREFCARWNVELVSLEDLLHRADFVTLHAPGGGENVHLIDAERLALMKPTAYLVNTARGSLIDEDALYAALTAGKLGGAGLDVREQEPPTDTRFNDLPNVILTAHIAGVTVETGEAMSAMAVESVLQAACGERPHGLLNPEAWDHRRR
ncbi:MAG: phosphoglycerate dehydrogenase [Chloroflexota bacterium]|nr:phosphoglycerate dehydrogenase [Chloroflexota bacterium]